MKEIRFVLRNEMGLHARPAATFVQTAAQFKSRVTVFTDEGKTADGKSILGVLGLGARQGTALTITIDGEDEEQAAAALQTFLEGQTSD